MTEYRKCKSRSSTKELREFIFSGVDLKDKKVLNLGSGNDYVDGWINLDGDHNVKADIYEDLESFVTKEKDFESYDIIYASHILEHIYNIVKLKIELELLLKPGGLLVVVVPDYLSPDAWGDDTHCRAFSKESFLLEFWPGFITGKIRELNIEKDMGTCKWIVAYLSKGGSDE